MSYCRWSEGDVYAYEAACEDSRQQRFVCCACPFNALDDGSVPDDEEFPTRVKLLQHLRTHEEAGHSVPVKAFSRLEQEIEQEGAERGKKNLIRRQGNKKHLRKR